MLASHVVDKVFAKLVALRTEDGGQQGAIGAIVGSPEGVETGRIGDIRIDLASGTMWIKTAGQQTTEGWQELDVRQRPDTIHFEIGNVGGIPAPTAPGTPNPATMAFFGQLNIATDREIEVIHLHLTEQGAAPTVINMEFYRERNDVFTRIAELSYVAPFGSNFTKTPAFPVGALAESKAGDYLYAQHVTGTTLAGGGNGMTLDVHFK